MCYLLHKAKKEQGISPLPEQLFASHEINLLNGSSYFRCFFYGVV